MKFIVFTYHVIETSLVPMQCLQEHLSYKKECPTVQIYQFGDTVANKPQHSITSACCFDCSLFCSFGTLSILMNTANS